MTNLEPQSLPSDQSKVDSLPPAVINHLFIFLEIFAAEGGIQSYVKDILQAYSSLNSNART